MRAAFDAVLASLGEGQRDTLSIDADYYWSLRPYEEFDALNIPSPTIGQYSETWENLTDERNGESDMTVPFSAVWLGEILVALDVDAH